MKRIYTASLILLALATVQSTRAADDAKSNRRTITVSGTAMVEATPDMVVLSITVKNVNLKSTDVAEEHTALIERVKQAMLDQKLRKEDLSTSNAQFGANYERKSDETIFKGYFASSDMSITLRDLTTYKPVWKALAGITGVTIDQVRFDHSERTKFQERAQVNSVKAAKKKAERLAEAGECSIGLPIEIREQSSNFYYTRVQSFNNVAQTSAPEEATGSGGKLQISASVEVVYELNPVKK